MQMTTGQYANSNSTSWTSNSNWWTTPTSWTQTMPIQTTTLASFETRRPSLRERIRDGVRSLGLRAASERGGALPAMAGGSPESETTKTVEYSRKKIILKRQVGVPRDKGSGIEEIHKGTVELVRAAEGDPHQLGSIGVKATPEGNSWVEIPIEDLLDAVEELRDMNVIDITKKGK